MPDHDRGTAATVVFGAPGAGKTAFLHHLMRNLADRRLATIAIDTSGLDVDITWPYRSDDGGSWCAGRIERISSPDRTVLHARVRAAVAAFRQRERRIDRLVLEVGGLCAPASVSAIFSGNDDGEPVLGADTWLDTTITVVDAAMFECDCGSAMCGDGMAPDSQRRAADFDALILAQVAAADIVVLNKADRLPRGRRRHLESRLRRLNPVAVLVSAVFGIVPNEVVRSLSCREHTRPDPATPARRMPTPAAAWHPSPSDVSAFVYRARRPFHPGRFHAWAHTDWAGVLRSRGLFWLATRPDVAMEWSWARGTGVCTPGGWWWGDTPSWYWPADTAGLEQIADVWQDGCGDHRQELILIGRGMDEQDLRRHLDACLLTDVELALGRRWWQGLADPFPIWDGVAPPGLEAGAEVASVAARRPNSTAGRPVATAD